MFVFFAYFQRNFTTPFDCHFTGNYSRKRDKKLKTRSEFFNLPVNVFQRCAKWIIHFLFGFFANHTTTVSLPGSGHSRIFKYTAVDPGIRIRSVRNTCDFKFFNVASILKSETEQWFMMIYFVELVSTSRSTIQRGIGVDEITSNGWFPAFRTVMQRNTCHRGCQGRQGAAQCAVTATFSSAGGAAAIGWTQRLNRWT